MRPSAIEGFECEDRRTRFCSSRASGNRANELAFDSDMVRGIAKKDVDGPCCVAPAGTDLCLLEVVCKTLCGQ